MVDLIESIGGFTIPSELLWLVYLISTIFIFVFITEILSLLFIWRRR